MLDDLGLPRRLPSAAGGLVLRAAGAADVPALVALLADDPVSASRGDRGREADLPAYAAALAAIAADPRNAQLVGELDGAVAATFQLTLIPGLARVGATRLQVETVRVRHDLRSTGIGGALMRWVLDVAPVLGADLVQLTSDARREDAHRFYRRLGFTASHLGFKHVVRP